MERVVSKENMEMEKGRRRQGKGEMKKERASERETGR